MNYNTRTWNLRKSNSNILPSNTILLDLQCSEELILARMKPKTRYNIKVAQRKGVQVRSEEIGKREYGINYTGRLRPATDSTSMTNCISSRYSRPAWKQSATCR